MLLLYIAIPCGPIIVEPFTRRFVVVIVDAAMVDAAMVDAVIDDVTRELKESESDQLTLPLFPTVKTLFVDTNVLSGLYAVIFRRAKLSMSSDVISNMSLVN